MIAAQGLSSHFRIDERKKYPKECPYNFAPAEKKSRMAGVNRLPGT